MDALLILGGLLMILIGLVLLVMRGFATSLLWGWACLLPPLTLLFIARHWSKAKHALGCCALGMIPLVVGLAVMAAQDPQRLEAIVSLRWLQPEQQAPGALHIQLNGHLNGEPFAPREGELVDGVLSLREGQDFFARRELIIRGLPLAEQGLRMDVLPDDQGPLPEIELSWLSPGQDLPEARQVKGGYTLHLGLRPEAPNLLVGDFHLVLPPQFETTLSGSVEVFHNGLRYHNGQVDRSVDSGDTVAFVLGDYLQRRFQSRDVQLSSPVPSVSGTHLMLDVQARIDGREQRLPVSLSKHPQQGWRVDDDQFAALPPMADQASAAPVAEHAAPAEPASSVDLRRDFSMARLLSEPRRFVNQPMRVYSEKGSAIQGQFAGLEQGQVILRQRLNGSGEARFAMPEADIVHVELIDQ